MLVEWNAAMASYAAKIAVPLAALEAAAS